MSGIVLGYTPNSKLAKINFNASGWHDYMNQNLTDLDTIINAISGFVATSPWTNSTAFVAGDKRIDSTNYSIYICSVSHTSATSPTTFATDRANNPSYWSIYTNPPNAMGSWATATAYKENTWVVNGFQYALCLVDHTSGVFATDVAAGKWLVVVDLTAALATGLALGSVFTFTTIAGPTNANAGVSYTASAAAPLTLPTMTSGQTVVAARNGFDITIGRNSQTIDGLAEDFVLDVDKVVIMFLCTSAGAVVTRKIGELPT
jgi:hypothetical protein